MNNEKYQPKLGEIEQAERIMTKKQRELSEARAEGAAGKNIEIKGKLEDINKLYFYSRELDDILWPQIRNADDKAKENFKKYLDTIKRLIVVLEEGWIDVSSEPTRGKEYFREKAFTDDMRKDILKGMRRLEDEISASPKGGVFSEEGSTLNDLKQYFQK